MMKMAGTRCTAAKFVPSCAAAVLVDPSPTQVMATRGSRLILKVSAIPVITGIALTFKIKREPRVAMTWVGDGSTKTAAAHEGTNFAAVQRVPAIFIIENNQVALGTRLEQHHLPADFKDWPASYGVWGATFDGNNVLDAYAT